LEVVAGLRGLRVRDIMASDCLRVDGRLTLQRFADDYLLKTAQRCFVVEEAGKVVGLITATDLRRIERERWSMVPVSAVMRPFAHLRTVTPDTPVIDALQAMGREDLNQLPVVSNGRMEGMLSRSQILQALQVRAELSM